MAASVLQTFVRENLIDLDGDDTRLVKLQAAATELSAVCAARPITVAFPIFLAALRSEDEPDDRGLGEVSRIIEDHWSTYRSAFKDGHATTLYRAVALQAIVEAIESEPSLGTAITLLLRNLRSELAAGKCESAIGLVVDLAEEAFASERESSMTLASSEKATVAPSPKATKVDRATLKKRIEAAVGPHDRAGQQLDSSNEHWPNAGNPWSHDFSDRMTAIIGDFVDLAIAEAAKFDLKNHATFAASLAVVDVIDPAVKRSANLLWWRQSMYSESAGQPYRCLALADAVVHSAIDLAVLIPPAYEPALDSFLMEAILALDLTKEGVGATEILEALPLAKNKINERLQYETPAGLMLSALTRGTKSGYIAEAILPPQKWAVWLIRELMAFRAVEAVQTATENSDATE